MSERLEVHKTYKLFIGGDFPRSESGRSYAPTGQRERAAWASLKDVREAVVAARRAWEPWWSRPAIQRGQILYRIAEMMEARRSELLAAVLDEGRSRGDAEAEVESSIDCWVHYAGWSDKVASVTGGLNPVAGPYFGLTSPEPVGVVGVLAPQAPPLAGLSARLAPVIVGGNAVVAIASETHPRAALALAECLATSDVPHGVVNILTGRVAELALVLAGHGDVDSLDVTGVPSDLVHDLEVEAAGNLKRTVRDSGGWSPYEVAAFMELKSVWHPKGT